MQSQSLALSGDLFALFSFCLVLFRSVLYMFSYLHMFAQVY